MSQSIKEQLVAKALWWAFEGGGPQSMEEH